MDRREFLRLSSSTALSGALASGLVACGGGGGSTEAPAPPPNPIPPTPPEPNGPAESEWTALSQQFKGAVVRSAHADYERLRLPANARYDALRPLALLRCANSSDVQAGLEFARRLKLPLAARGGGHSYIGNSTGNGSLIIDVGAMNQVSLQGETAVVGAGATLADVYGALLTQGRGLPSGSCLSVGIAGITQGGGFGVLDRAYGLSCDVLRAARLVTADGRELLCDESQNSDLFWALRGGGGGNFGIVTEFSFQTHAVQTLTQFSADFQLSDLAAILAAWTAWPQTMPDAIWSQLLLTPQGTCRVWGICVGSEALLQAPWQALLTRIGRPPLAPPTVQNRRYEDVMLGDCVSSALASCHLPSQNPAGRLGRVAMAASSDFFDKALDASAAAAMAEVLRSAMDERRSSGRSGSVIMNLMGGAIGRIAHDATAFVHRQAQFSAQYYCDQFPGSPASSLTEADTWAQGMREKMNPWSSGRAYQNYLNASLPNPLQALYGSNLARLQAIKASVDPQGLFKQSLGLFNA
ncbi:FAD-dependent oxidoreductase [Paucibacter sp. Y2R2-4]|uniref:FAD-dependent oxidoreductase n=1 Tax=Paucibacter sp. Y2R2-4 TaxID=2893553 RepID=UPI0021E48F88|nr:FAD-binding oxidoreductase [Paucibacter sp. Y2R2-4]MCV2349630.1 FAD-binding oxidoreductase [Paucibacter sp. Y2R2-4]